jgi:NTE family protein
MEELRIPVDCVVGTSMGAVVGGLYAAGLSPERIREIMVSADWDDLFTDRPPRERIPFRRKQFDQLPLFEFEFGLNRSGLTLPTGLIAGQKLDFVLKAVLMHTTSVGSFDDLPVPYRAVATDLATGRMVVLDHGDLASALRASMSVPGAFSPIRIDGLDLVDGGIARNLPVGVARTWGAARVIAVDISNPVRPQEEEISALGVVSRTMNMLMEQNMEISRRSIGPSDYLIVPDLGDMGPGDFDRVTEAADLGKSAVLAQREGLGPFMTSVAEYESWKLRRADRLTPGDAPPVLDDLVISGLDRVDAGRVTSRLKTRVGEPLDLNVLGRDLARVYEMGEFERVEFDLDPGPDGNLLQVNATEKSWGPNFVRFGLELEADFRGSGEFAALAELNRVGMNRLGGEWRTLLAIGEENKMLTEFYQPLHRKGRWFVSPRLLASREREDLFNEDGSVSRFLVDSFEGRLDLGYQFGRYGEIRSGISRGRLNTDLDTGGVLENTSRVNTGGVRAALTLDQLDSANFPRHGFFLQSDLFLSRDRFGADQEFEQLFTRVVDAGTWGRNSLVGVISFGSDLGTILPPYAEFSLGGFLNLSGIPPESLRGQTAALAQLVVYRQISSLPAGLGRGIYLGGSLEAGNAWPVGVQPAWDDLRPAGALFLGVDSVFGPFFLGYGRSDTGDGSFYLFLGRPF